MAYVRQITAAQRASLRPRALYRSTKSYDHNEVVRPAELPALREQWQVTQELLVEGHHRVRVYSPDGGRPLGCEAVAQHVFAHVAARVAAETNGRVWLESVEVREHSGNSAIYEEARR